MSPAASRALGTVRALAGTVHVEREPARAATIALAALVYAALYPALFRALGPDVAAIITIGVLPASLAYGTTGGIVAAGLSIPANAALLQLGGWDAAKALESDWAGAITGMAAAIASGAARDLIRRVRTQAEVLERDRARLEIEVARRKRTERDLQRTNIELDLARDTAVRAARAKSVLLGRASHELRTPVASIVGYVELLREECARGEPTSLESDLGRVHGAATHLAAMLDDLLDIARLEAGQVALRFEPVSVAKIVDEVATMVAPLAERRGNRLRIEIANRDAVLVTDRRRIEQVLLNLLTNAAKFTERGEIGIHGALGRYRGQDMFQLSVSDTGVGLEPDEAERVFEEFYRGKARGAAPGTGLGLAITKQLCTALGAEIDVSSAPGAGTRFVVWLPLAPPR